MSSFASVLVAKAKATPENVVPFPHVSRTCGLVAVSWVAYEIDTNNQLSLTSACTFHLCRPVVDPLLVHLRGLLLAVASIARWLCAEVGIAPTVALGGIDGWGVMRHLSWRQRAVGPTGRSVVGVGRRTAELVLAHGRRQTGLGGICRGRGVCGGGGGGGRGEGGLDSVGTALTLGSEA